MATKFLGGIDVSGDFLSTTPPLSDNSTKVATTAFVKGQGYLNSLPTHTHAWTDITGKPSTFAPSAHTHSISDVTGLQTALDGKQPAGSYLTSIPAEYLTNEEADSLYQVRGSYASESHTHTFSSITSKPTTLSGYGITDAATSAQGTKADTAHGWGNHALAGYLTSGSGVYATESYVNDAVASVVDSAPERLDTLRELAQALGDDHNFATTITDLIAGKANESHTHTIANVTGLQTALDGKQAAGSYAAASHTHTIANVTGLQTALDGKQAAGSYAASSHTHGIGSITDAERWWNNFGDNHSFRTSFDAEGETLTTGFGWRYVQGLGNAPGVGDTGNGQYYALSVGLGNEYSSLDYAMQLAIPRGGSNPYISIRFQEGGRLGAWTKISAAYADSAGSVDWGGVSGKPSTFAPSSHTHTIANVTDLQTALDGKQAAGSYAAASHGHTIANITGLQDALDDKQARGEYLTSLGFSYSTGVNGSHVVQRDVNGYIYANHINFSTGETENPSINSFFVSNGDGWSRKASVAHVKSQLGLGSAAYESTGSFVASNGSSWTPHPSSSRDAAWNTFHTDYGYIQFGPANGSWAHIYSDKNFYFNRDIYVNDAKLATESYVTARGYITSVPAQSWSSITSKPAGWLDTPCLVQDHVPSGTAQPSGFYQSYQGAGNPTGTWFNYVNVRHSNPNNGHGFQAGMSYYDNTFWFRSYQGGLDPSFQEWAYAISSQNIGEQSVNYASSAGSVAWGNVTGRPSALSSFTNDLGNYGGWITSDGRAYPRRANGVDMNFYWDGQGGQPTWLWGSNDGQNMYVWNPSNFSVNYATSAGNSATTSQNTFDRIGVGQAANGNYRIITSGDYYANAGGNYWAEGRFKQYRGSGTWYDVIDSGNIGDQSVNYANSAGSASNASNADALGGIGVGGFLRDDGWNTYPGQDANSQGTMRSDFTYSNNAPFTGELIRFGASGYSIQLNGSYGGSRLAYRTYQGDQGRWNEWYTLIDSSNIGDQSVSYASSAGNADTIDGYHLNQSVSVNASPTFTEVYANGWFRTTGHQGLYNPTNNAHFRPNPHSYGAWSMIGSKNGWKGIEFEEGGNGNVSLMVENNSATSGFHNNSYGWQMRWYNGTMYIGKNAYGGNEAVVLDSSNWTSYISVGSQLVTGDTSRARLNTSKFDIYNNNITEDPVILQMNGTDILVNDPVQALSRLHGGIDGATELMIDTSGFYFWTTEQMWMPIFCEYVEQVSDIKLKHQIQTIPSALEKVNQLRGVEFLWKSNNKPSIGFIAQEVEEVVPVAVGNHNGTKTIDYSKIIPILTQAIKEQQDQINILTQEIQLLKTK